MKKLTIGLPTYNREKKISNLLDFLYCELDVLSIDDRKKIEISISDNCSTDNTKKCIEESKLYRSGIVDITYFQQNTNTGLLGNLKYMYSTADGEYFWIMGDDDEYKASIVKNVLNECAKDEYSYIFINHSTFKDGRTLDKSVINDLDVNRTDKDFLWELYKKSGTVMMFLSACVCKTKYIKEYIKKNNVNLVAPCSLSFYCASKGKTKVIPEPLIVDDYTNISWGKYMFQVFQIEIPRMILVLPSWGYNRWKCYSEVARIMWRSKKVIIKHLLRLDK